MARRMYSEKQVEKMISDKLESMGIKVENDVLVISRDVTVAEAKTVKLPQNVVFSDDTLMQPKAYGDLTSGDVVITAYSEE